MKPIIEVKNYTKKYGDFTAVDDVSFEVEEGSIFAFLGAKWSGKKYHDQYIMYDDGKNSWNIADRRKKMSQLKKMPYVKQSE
ncbi:MAG: hypothetical protein U5K84_13290 [Alkalibacterium sp.]|nr:hypothetical protein [Alkalibacterium sp.]